MKILNIKSFDAEQIVVEVEGFPHAQPVFPNTLTEQELQTAVDAWAYKQDLIDKKNKGTATEEELEEVESWNTNPFIPEQAIAREAQVFPVDRIIALAPFTYTINEMIRYENWTQLKQVIQGLMQGGVATQADYEMFNGILKEQNIDLDNI